MLQKSDIINFLYVLSFPVYGLGLYVSGNISPSIGYLMSMSVFLLIVFFYFVDVLYKKEFTIRLNFVYVLMALYLLSLAVSQFVGLSRHSLNATTEITYIKVILLILPFHAFIAVFLYNESNTNRLVQLTFKSLSYLLVINMIGFAMGLTNGVHNIGGRVNFPFLDGIYSGACLLAILCLMIFHYMKKYLDDPVRFTGLLLYFIISLVLLYFVNSRLTNMIFLIVFLMFVFKVSRGFKLIYFIALFTIPLLLNLGMLLYQLLSLPVFTFIMKRVNVSEVTTFNGRAFVWQRAVDWLLYDHSGLIFGNGTNGQYYLHLMPDIAKLWGVAEQSSHLHSTILTALVDQGLVGYLLLVVSFYHMFNYYRIKYQTGDNEGVYFSVVVFLLIVMQIDSFVSGESLGAVLFSFLIAKVSLNLKGRNQVE